MHWRCSTLCMRSLRSSFGCAFDARAVLAGYGRTLRSVALAPQQSLIREVPSLHALRVESHSTKRMYTRRHLSAKDVSVETPALKGYRFGVFEVDLASAEVRRDGRQIRVRGMPFDILVSLLERPGELVSRDDLRQRLWSADTFVDFDHGLNAAVNRLRDALGDSAENPRFIQTI